MILFYIQKGDQTFNSSLQLETFLSHIPSSNWRQGWSRAQEISFLPLNLYKEKINDIKITWLCESRFVKMTGAFQKVLAS